MDRKIRNYVRVLLWGTPVIVGVGVLSVLLMNNVGSSAKPLQAPAAQADLNCIQLAKDFTDYPLVFSGAEVEGHPLTRCQRVQTPANSATGVPAMDYFVFLYGSCTPRDDAGCPAPIEVLVDPPCAPALAEGATKEKIRVRGKDADVKTDGSLRIETDDFKVTIYALGTDYEDAKGKAIDVANALQGANNSASDLTSASDLGVKMKGNTVCK
jgi:hypothetical protein